MTKYEIIYEALQEKVNNNEIDITFAEEVNVLAYEKYKDDIDKKYTYKNISSNEIDKFYKDLDIVFNSNSSKHDISRKDVLKCIKIIKCNNKFIGYIGFSYFNEDNRKYLGLSNFAIIPKYQRMGHGTNIINDIIEQYKNKYDEIYCWVSKDNKNAISFYKKIANVTNKLNKDNMYYVELYKKK